MSFAGIFGNVTPSQPVTCDRYYTEKNRTTFVYGGYEGIPENLLINFIAWILLLLLFSLLRKIAWDYGRIALVSRAEARWTSLFYGENASERQGSQESLDTLVHRQDKGFCSWIPAFFRIKDEHILQKCGSDAIQYIKFQRYLLVYMAVITVLSIAVILPCNFQGDLEGDKQTFGHTTISNVQTNSPILWVHAVFSVIYLIIAIVFMRHFSVNLQYEEDEKATRTLMVFNIPREHCYKNLLMTHFQEAYPNAPVQDIQFAYNISKLAKLDKNRQWAFECLINSEQIHKQTGERPVMLPLCCGACCQKCSSQCCGKEVDCIDYYNEKEQEFTLKCDDQKVKAFKHTLGIAFVTFENDQVARRVHNDFKVSCRGAHNPMPSSVSRQLSAHNWEVRYAPAPDNICWDNLSVSPALWWMKAVLINLLLFILLFFITTPSVFLNLLNLTNYQQDLEDHIHSPVIVHFVPTLLLVVASGVLPQLVYYTDVYIVGHWTKSALHHAIMRKTYILLLLMVVVLPSLGLTSAKALVDWLSQKEEGTIKFRWQCIFIPDNGAFFVNYVITTAFIGQAIELVRIPELLLYAIKMLCAKSVAERTSIRKSLVWEYQFGCHYAWMLCVFSVVITYSIPCPLITPFGLVYLIMKHMFDRYNIYFAYAPSKIDKNIHTSAVNFVIVSVILLQFAIVFFTILRAEAVHGIAIFSVVALFLTMIIFFGRICFGWFRGLSPIAYKQTPREFEGEEVNGQKPFIAPVLILPNEASTNTRPDDSGMIAAPQSYGAVEQDQMTGDNPYVGENEGFIP